MLVELQEVILSTAGSSRSISTFVFILDWNTINSGGAVGIRTDRFHQHLGGGVPSLEVRGATMIFMVVD